MYSQKLAPCVRKSNQLGVEQLGLDLVGWIKEKFPDKSTGSPNFGCKLLAKYANKILGGVRDWNNTSTTKREKELAEILLIIRGSTV